MSRFEPKIKHWLVEKTAFLKWPLVALVAMSTVLSSIAVIFSYFSKQIIDAAQAQQRSVFIINGVLIISILIFQLLFKATYNYLMIYYRSLTDKKMKAYVYQDIIQKKQVFLDSLHTGQLMNHLESDVESVSEGIVEILPKIVFLVLRFVFAFVLLLFLDVLFSILMLGFGILLLITSFFVGSEIKRRHHLMQDAEAKLRSFMQESLEHIMLIKSFEAESFSDNSLENNQNNFLKAKLYKNKFSILAGTILNAFFAAGYAFALIYGAYKIGVGAFTIGTLVAVIQLVQYMQSPFSGFSILLSKYYAMLASSERLMTFEKLPNEHKCDQAIDIDFECVIFENVTFKYDRAIILKDFNFKIRPHTFIHIKGDSGIGKTTLFKLLLGLIEPNEGSIIIKRSTGNIKCSENTRARFTYVPQGLMVMSGSIRDILVYNQRDVSDKVLIEASKIAAIYDDIVSLPDDFDTKIGERGIGLSEGQIQRLAIARALIKDAPILLLDEITSALDAKTEEVILKNIKSLTSKTCLIISHRLLDEDIIDQTITL